MKISNSPQPSLPAQASLQLQADLRTVLREGGLALHYQPQMRDGGLHGVVETISPDTIQDEAKPEVFYYRVFIRTSQDYLVNKAGRHFSIVPGMIATVDIKTGEKTVLDYMIKPFNRAKEALRER